MQYKPMQQGIALGLAMLLVGCATYTPLTVGIPEVSDPSAVKKTTGALILSVEEYATKEKAHKAFDTDLVKEGVLPLLLTVENKGQESYEFQWAEIVVRDGDSALKGLTPEEAGRHAKRGAVGRAIGWGLIVPIIGIPIAVATSAVHTGKVNDRVIQDFIAKAFKDGELKPQEKRTGFVFFELPKSRKNVDGLQLEMTARNAATHEPVTITTPLPMATFTSHKEESGDARTQ